MESNKPLRTHPKMTKVLLGQIDSLDKAGHSVEDIAATLILLRKLFSVASIS